jgi:hypothetical protein
VVLADLQSCRTSVAMPTYTRPPRQQRRVSNYPALELTDLAINSWAQVSQTAAISSTCSTAGVWSDLFLDPACDLLDPGRRGHDLIAGQAEQVL